MTHAMPRARRRPRTPLHPDHQADRWLRRARLAWVTPILRLIAGDNPQGAGQGDLATCSGSGSVHRRVPAALGRTRAEGPDLARRHPGPGSGLGTGQGAERRCRRRTAQGGGILRPAGRKERRSWSPTGKADEVKIRTYTGKPTYYQQIWTSIKTVFFGFLIGTLDRRAARHRRRPVAHRQRGDQPADPDLQAGLATGLAADRDDGRLGALSPATAACRKAS